MASAVPVRPFHLAVVGLGLACLLLSSSAAAATTSELLHASAMPHDDTTLTVAGRPASSHHHRASSSASTSTIEPDDGETRRLDVSAVAREDATCTVYRYLPDGSIDRALPFAGLRKVCNAGSDELARSVACACREGLVSNPIQRYCHVRTLELSERPEGLDCCVLPGHLPPITNPGAVVAGGGEVCYVELEHGHHMEGYYILCPVLKCPRFPLLCCPEVPHGAAAVVAAA